MWFVTEMQRPCSLLCATPQPEGKQHWSGEGSTGGVGWGGSKGWMTPCYQGWFLPFTWSFCGNAQQGWAAAEVPHLVSFLTEKTVSLHLGKASLILQVPDLLVLLSSNIQAHKGYTESWNHRIMEYPKLSHWVEFLSLHSSWMELFSGTAKAKLKQKCEYRNAVLQISQNYSAISLPKLSLSTILFVSHRKRVR